MFSLMKFLRQLMKIGRISFMFSLTNFIWRFIPAFGVGFYSFDKLNDFFEILKSEMARGYRSIPSDVLALMDMSGIAYGINLFLSSMMFLVSYYLTRTAVSFLFK